MRTIVKVFLTAVVLLSMFAGCGRKRAQDAAEPAYFDGFLLASDSGVVYSDRSNFVRFIVTDESLGKLAPVLQTLTPGDTAANSSWVEFYGSVAPKDSVMRRGMEMYITVDSLIGFGPFTGRVREHMVGSYELAIDTMEYQFRVFPNYTYILNEYAQRRDIMVSKAGTWKRTDAHTLLFTEDDRLFVYDNRSTYSSLLTKPGKDSCEFKTMRFVFDPDSHTLIEKEAGEIVFWRIAL